MKTLKKIILPFLTGLFFFSSSLINPTESSAQLKIDLSLKSNSDTCFLIDSSKPLVKDTYSRDNIKLKKLDELAFNIWPRIELPSDLCWMIHEEQNIYALKNKVLFEDKIYEIAEKLGYKKKDIKCLDPLKVIKLTADVVSYQLTPSMKYNSDFSKSVDEIFLLGEAECSMYTCNTAAVFNVFKEINPLLANVYVIDQKIGRTITHDWNDVLVVGKNNLQISSIDVLFYDRYNSIDAVDDYHTDFNLWRVEFYRNLLDMKSAIKEVKLKLNSVEDTSEIKEIKEELGACFFIDRDYDSTIVFYNQLLKDYPEDSFLEDDALYRLGESYFQKGKKDTAKKYFKELLKKYPESYLAENVKKEHSEMIK